MKRRSIGQRGGFSMRMVISVRKIKKDGRSAFIAKLSCDHHKKVRREDVERARCYNCSTGEDIKAERLMWIVEVLGYHVSITMDQAEREALNTARGIMLVRAGDKLIKEIKTSQALEEKH